MQPEDRQRSILDQRVGSATDDESPEVAFDSFADLLESDGFDELLTKLATDRLASVLV